MCGVSKITRPAIEVSRRGSVGATQLATWRAVTVNRTALGGAPSPVLVEGHLCPACTGAIDEVGGIGWHARGLAVVAAARATRGEEEAGRLRRRLASDLPPSVPAWGVLPEPRVPNETPWGHLAALLGPPGRR